MNRASLSEIRKDALIACQFPPEILSKFLGTNIVVTGGTGFLGSWIAEVVTALNDEYRLAIKLSLYARNVNEWASKFPHLSSRADIRLISQDVRSQFEFPSETNFVIHAAGIPNSRVHSSDPLRVNQTTILGIGNVLNASSQLARLHRVVVVSSCLVNGPSNRFGALKETDYFPLPCDQLHMVYAEAKRAAESIASIYRSQFRMPVTIVRPFTFAGPYQEIESPWAINNFMRDALSGGDIRVHGDGSARRSYLYGSDAAWWILAALVYGEGEAIYNLGSPNPISHLELAQLVANVAPRKPQVLLNTLSTKQGVIDDLFPDTDRIERVVGVRQTCGIQQIIDKTFRWFQASVY